ncbi:MAG: glycosyltransferase family 9 protein [Candidatus Sumerlaeia bacterium]
MRLSVIILTCNRLGRLLSCLEKLLPQLDPADEVVLIDTGSTDGTVNYFQTWSHPQLRFEMWRGHGSWAEIRNFGVSKAQGGLIAFLDDDCIPEADWVARGRDGLEKFDAVGGLVQPHGIDEWPCWWHPDMGWMVGLSVPGQLGPEAGRYHYPFTANLWARAAACRALPFQEIGGRLGGAESGRYLTGREDAQWWHALRVGGFATGFDPKMLVHHAIEPSRLDLRYLRQRAGLDGQAWALRSGTRQDLFPLAYQWHLQLDSAFKAPWAEPGSRRAHWHFHQLMRRRHGRALKVLAERFLFLGKLAPWLVLQPFMAAASMRYEYDRLKALAREAAGPHIESRPRQPLALRVDRVAVLAMAYLGDLVILQSVLRGLMQRHPRLEVYVLAPASARVALSGIPRLNVTTLPDLKPDSRQARAWLARWLEQVDADAIVAPYLHEPWGRTVTSIQEPPRPIIAFDIDQGLKRMWRLKRLSVRVHKNLSLHESENLCRLFEVAGLPSRPVPASIAPDKTAAARVEADEWLSADPRRPMIMLNPEAGTPYKEWTAEAWQRLAQRLLAETDCRIVVNASRGQSPLDELIEANKGQMAALREEPLEGLVAWLARCKMLVTVDAGPQHLAHALNVPSLTLYGPMDERRWRDRFDRPIHRTIRACSYDLTPEEKRGLPLNHEVSLIDPDDVFQKLSGLPAFTDAQR